MFTFFFVPSPYTGEVKRHNSRYSCQLSFSMCAHHSHHHDMPGPLDDFLAQLMGDIPNFFPIPATASLPPYPSTSALVTVHPTDDHDGQDPPLTCQWVVTRHPTLVCSALLPADRDQACAHLRQAHDVRGNEKAIIRCDWRDCPAPPMQRGSLIRHVLSVHMGLLRWRCEACGKVFSRKGTGHACVDAEGA